MKRPKRLCRCAPTSLVAHALPPNPHLLGRHTRKLCGFMERTVDPGVLLETEMKNRHSSLHSVLEDWQCRRIERF